MLTLGIFGIAFEMIRSGRKTVKVHLDRGIASKIREGKKFCLRNSKKHPPGPRNEYQWDSEHRINTRPQADQTDFSRILPEGVPELVQRCASRRTGAPSGRRIRHRMDTEVKSPTSIKSGFFVTVNVNLTSETRGSDTRDSPIRFPTGDTFLRATSDIRYSWKKPS